MVLVKRPVFWREKKKKKNLYTVANLKIFGECREARRSAGSNNNIGLGAERVNNKNQEKPVSKMASNYKVEGGKLFTLEYKLRIL